MQKYLYAIRRFKIKSWIKYWLIKQTEFKGVLSEILEGISFYLTDSLNMKFKMFKIYGRTTQESTTGKNLCTGAELQSNENIKFYFDRNYLEKTFTLSFICNEALNANSVYLDKSNGTEYLLSMSSVANTTAKVTITLTDEQYNAIQSATYWNLRIYKGGASFTVPKEPMIQNGSTATPYEPYTGGEPAPNPNYPMDIKNTGDNGSVNEKVQNNNLAKEEFDVKFSTSGSGQNRTVIATSHKTAEIIRVKPNTSYVATGDFFSLSDNVLRIGMFDNYPVVGSISTKHTFSGAPLSFTTDINTKYIMLYNASGASDVVVNRLQLEQGSTASNYQAHSEQNISFPLAQGQKLMQGDYLADDGVHHVRGEKVFDGSDDENWTFEKLGALGDLEYRNNFYIKINDALGDKNSSILNNMGIYANELRSNYNTYISNEKNLNYLCNDFESVEEFKEFLKTNNMKVQYKLETEVIDPYTEEQKTAWEQIKALRTYKNVTHISSEDETPALLKIQYWKEA